MQRRRQRGSGFTLIELMVTVGIIAVLVSILLPAVNTARHKAKSVQCQSNLKNLEQAFTAYCQSNNGRAMAYVTPPSSYTPVGTQIQYGYPNFWVGLLKPFGVNSTVIACPEAYEPGSGGVGTATLGWGGPNAPSTISNRIGTNVGSYGFNGWLYEVAASSSVQPPQANGNPAPLSWHLPVSADNTQIPVFADSVWVEGWPTGGDQVPPAPAGVPPGSLTGPGPTIAGNPSSTSNYMQEFCINRHVERRVNIVFLDGHADSFDLPELWSVGSTAPIRWSPSYVPPTTLSSFP